jgi:hypothetical protein
VSGEELESEFVAANYVVVEPVDFDVSAHNQVSWGDVLVVLVHVFVLSSLQKWPFDYARVLLGRLVNRHGIVCKVERNYETAVNIFRNTSV